MPQAAPSFGQPRPASASLGQSAAWSALAGHAGLVFDTGTEPQSAYVVPSAKTARRETIRLGLLPSRDPNVPRTANIIKPKDHSIWKVSTVSKW